MCIGDIVRWEPDIIDLIVDLGAIVEIPPNCRVHGTNVPGAQVGWTNTEHAHWIGCASSGWFAQEELRTYCAKDKLW